ncbi:MAG: DUF86 domain-containing protein [Planctomycetaceae bacterium]|nr:DUF86 domain-containing protein [Planctomycetaceae bacterium]
MNSLDPNIVKLLRDIIASSRRIITVVSRETRDSFIDPANLNAQDIVARRLTIIGEAAAALMQKHAAFCSEHTEIPLRQARGMRNFIVHNYDGVDWETVWDTTQLLPALVESIAPLVPA